MKRTQPIKRRRKARRRPEGWDDPAYLQAVRETPCVLCGSPAEPHHKKGGYGTIKAPDRETMALCREHHTSGGRGIAFHSTPRSEWEARWGTQDELIQRTADYICEHGLL